MAQKRLGAADVIDELLKRKQKEQISNVGYLW